MFHLVTHAFFKALLFLAAGSVILGMEHGEHAASHGGKQSGKKRAPEPHGRSDRSGRPVDPQDMRNMGGLRERMPVTFWVYLIGALALSGIAPLAGFFSKDEILAEASPAAGYLCRAAGGRLLYRLLHGAADPAGLLRHSRARPLPREPAKARR